MGMKLPLFWVNNPRMWFQTAEAQFRIKGITHSMTKFDHVLARIPSELTISLADVMEAALLTSQPLSGPLYGVEGPVARGYSTGPV